ERLEVAGAALPVTEGVDGQPEARQPERAQEAVGEGDDLHVEGGVVDAEHLHAELVVLAVAAPLGLLVAEVRGEVPDLPRRGGPVLDVGPHHRSRPFGAEGQPAASSCRQEKGTSLNAPAWIWKWVEELTSNWKPGTWTGWNVSWNCWSSWIELA